MGCPDNGASGRADRSRGHRLLSASDRGSQSDQALQCMLRQDSQGKEMRMENPPPPPPPPEAVANEGRGQGYRVSYMAVASEGCGLLCYEPHTQACDVFCGPDSSYLLINVH